MKYAVLETGGKQYIAREGETIEVDRLPMEAGKPIAFKNVLLVVNDGDVKVGAPYVKGAQVKGTVVAEVKAPKIIVFKYIPKERYRRKQGHRQHYTRIAVNSISVRAPRTQAKGAEAEKEKEAAKPKTEAKPKRTATSRAKTSTAKPKPTTKAKARRTTTSKPKTTPTKPDPSSKPSNPPKSSSSRSSKAATSSSKSRTSESSVKSHSKKSEE